MQLVFTPPHGLLYDAERALRWEVLRRPLGHARGTERFDFEDEALHLVAVEDGEVVGCVLFHADGTGGGRLFQMAVREDRQGTGLGARLVRHLEDRLRQDGVREVRLHARMTAHGFYEKLGYVGDGTLYIEVGLPHMIMTRAL